MNKKGKIIGLSLIAIMVVLLFTASISTAIANGKPDLVITDVRVDGNVICYTIKNIGDVAAPRSLTGLWIDGVYRASNMDKTLAPGEESDVCFPRYNYRGGEILVCADYPKQIDESEETNNCRTGPLPPPEKPDLKVFDKTETVVGSTFKVTYVVGNFGTANAGESVACVYINGVHQAGKDVTISALAAGDCTGPITVGPFNCSCGGEINVTVCADNYNNVDESDETNNCLTNYDVECPCPDLIIIGKDETVNTTANTFNVTFKVKNNGTAAAVNTSKACIYINGAHQAGKDVNVSALAVGIEESFDVGPFNCPPCGDTKQVKVCADNYDNVSESNEANNCMENTVECPCPDLIIIDKDETVNTTANTFNVTFKVKNNGTAAAVNTSKACIYINGAHQAGKDVNVSALAVGIEESFDVGPFNCPPCGDTKQVKVCADNYDNVSESNEANNCMENTVECPCPDLIIIDKDETVNTTANTFNVTFKVKNNGTAAAVNTSKACIYIDCVHVKDVNVSALTVGIEEEFDVGPFNCPPCGETKQVKVCADNYDNVSESNETNNCMENTVECPCPDLIISYKNETVNTTANTFNVTFKVKNNGTAAAVNTSKACIYIAGAHQAGKDVDVSALTVGAEEPFDVGPFNCPCGTTVVVKVCADNYGNVSESNETNNCMVNTVVCPPCPCIEPDLIIPNVWTVGNIIHYNITNQGGAAAPRSLTGLWVDGAYRASNMDKPLAPGEESNEVFARYNYRGGEILVCADYPGLIEEANDGNNCWPIV